MDFNVNDTISVKIPKDDRNSTDLVRLPGIITNKSSGTQPTYRVITEFGTLKKRYSSSNLMPFNGKVKLPNNITKVVTLREAARESNNHEVVFCHCKGDCSSRRCRCFSQQCLCSSRCHSGHNKNCDNFHSKKSDNAESLGIFLTFMLNLLFGPLYN